MANKKGLSRAQRSAQQSANAKSQAPSGRHKHAPHKKAPTKASRGAKRYIPYVAVGLVVSIVAVLIIVSQTSKSGGNGGSDAFQPASASLIQSVNSIPASVYDTVGVTSSTVQVNPPTATTGQPQLTFANAEGKQLPGFFYFGADYCPYCAAERWAVVAALSRFGKWSDLGLTSSSSSDVYPSTQTFSFVKASLSSQYLAFRGVEHFGSVVQPNGQYSVLQNPTKEEAALLEKYDSPTYIANGQAGSIPFISIGNQFVSAGSAYSPSILQGLSRSQIAQGLSDPTNPATQAIISDANYMTAAICHITNGNPGNVCNSKGVQAAAKVMKI